MTGWAVLESSRGCLVEVKVERHALGLVFISGTVDTGAEIKALTALSELKDYGFDYPDYIADINEQLEKHEQEEQNTFI